LLNFSTTNVIGTHALLECARQAQIKRFIYVSTDEVYGTTGPLADLNQPLNPNNPYACSKLAAEYIAVSYQKSFDMPILIIRSNNVYGPHQFVEKVIPKFIIRLLGGKTCCVHGDGSSERGFLYISDMVEAYDILLHYGKTKMVYNVGASEDVSVRDLATTLVRQIKHVDNDKINEFIEHVEPRVIDDKRYRIDSSHIKNLGWNQKVSFEDGIKMTIDWYKTNPNYWNEYEYALEPHITEKGLAARCLFD
jgi:dTDP-glucose 4,6-dehydratase